MELKKMHYDCQQQVKIKKKSKKKLHSCKSNNTFASLPRTLNHDAILELFSIVQDENKTATERNNAKNKIVESNIKLVLSVANNLFEHTKKGSPDCCISIDDLIQEGMIGLMHSIDKFECSKGYKFSTYAVWWIRQSIGHYIAKNKRIVRLPSHAIIAAKKMHNNEEVVVSEKVATAIKLYNKAAISITSSINSNNDYGEHYTLEDTLMAPMELYDPEYLTQKKEAQQLSKDILAHCTQEEIEEIKNIVKNLYNKRK